jgi:hypothetical protein
MAVRQVVEDFENTLKWEVFQKLVFPKYREASKSEYIEYL